MHVGGWQFSPRPRAAAEPAGGIRKLEVQAFDAVHRSAAERRGRRAARLCSIRPFRSGATISASTRRKHADWQVTGCLMKRQERFQAAGLLPRDLPQFLQSGYARTIEFWLDEQNERLLSPAFAAARRDARLHVLADVRRVWPSWYFEGMAELLATHRLDDGKLLVHQFPR